LTSSGRENEDSYDRRNNTNQRALERGQHSERDEPNYTEAQPNDYERFAPDR
jgi:hypothetical protein